MFASLPLVTIAFFAGELGDGFPGCLTGGEVKVPGGGGGGLLAGYFGFKSPAVACRLTGLTFPFGCEACLPPRAAVVEVV